MNERDAFAIQGALQIVLGLVLSGQVEEASQRVPVDNGNNVVRVKAFRLTHQWGYGASVEAVK